jgi:hypothetical protein
MERIERPEWIPERPILDASSLFPPLLNLSYVLYVGPRHALIIPKQLQTGKKVKTLLYYDMVLIDKYASLPVSWNASKTS